MKRLGPEGSGVSAVLGAILMLCLMMTLVPGAVLLRGAISDEMSAQREAAQRAAWCARHTEIGPPECPDVAPLPGYECVEAELEVWVCSRPPSVPVPTPTVSVPAVPTPTVVTPTLPTPTVPTPATPLATPILGI